ncbi:acyltransferase [Phyllobacterium sp. LjRoot231]|uniref:acyltransferase family protein n=1 Tax=Phyllobacterium sp. LjRoot231 TaxID=3342289 RepID=UPI003ECECBE1
MGATARRSDEESAPILQSGLSLSNSEIAMSSRLIGLDITRIFAATAVMIFHLGFWSWARPNGTAGSVLSGIASYPELADAWWGSYGVQIFFVLSGFVIAYSASQSTVSGFILNRFLRLFPVALVCATITFLVSISIALKPTDALLQDYVRTVLFDPFGPWIDGVYWTLGIEIVFYAVVAICIGVGLRSKLEFICCTIGLLSSALWVANWLGYFPTIYERTSLLLLGAHGVYFACGAIIWGGMTKGWGIHRIVVGSLLAASGYLGIVLTAPELIALAGNGSSVHPPAIIWLSAIAFMIASARADRLVQRIIRPSIQRTIRFLGIATYPLYLIHDLIGASVMRGLIEIGVNRWVSLVFACVSMVTLASIITAFIEPVLRIQTKRLLYFLGLLKTAPNREEPLVAPSSATLL